MISTFNIISLIFVHFLADFVLQTDFQAKNKSKSFKALILHTLTYSVFTAFLWGILFGLTTIVGAKVFLITLLFHTVTDFFTSKLNKSLIDKGDIHTFFVSVGFDQVLHYVQLILTFIYLTN